MANEANSAADFFLASIFELEANKPPQQLIDSNHRYMSIFLLNSSWGKVTVYYYTDPNSTQLSISIAERGVARIDAFSNVSATATKAGDLALLAFYKS
jgi:hypothetical protein